MTKPEFIRAATPKYKARYDNFIGGQWVSSITGDVSESYDPATGRFLPRFPRLQRPMSILPLLPHVAHSRGLGRDFHLTSDKRCC